MRLTACLLAVVLSSPASLQAQGGPPESLSYGEIEALRDAAPIANQRVGVFQEFLQERITRIDKLASGKRHAGREQDMHDLLEEFAGIANEFEDNLDDYGEAHRDVRKAVPKLLKAMDNWQVVLQKPPDDDAYNVSRKLALEALDDLRQQAKETLDAETSWFVTHPPAKEPGQDKPGLE